MGRQRPPKDAVEIPIEPELDLHNFAPKDVASVVEEYLEACVHKDLYEVRLIHGKGIGNLRRTVHIVLDRHKNVSSYYEAPNGNWGATVVTLKRTR
jgi:dsDNA-specific endonuclease/ATPase MutS2